MKDARGPAAEPTHICRGSKQCLAMGSADQESNIPAPGTSSRGALAGREQAVPVRDTWHLRCCRQPLPHTPEGHPEERAATSEGHQPLSKQFRGSSGGRPLGNNSWLCQPAGTGSPWSGSGLNTQAMPGS